MRQREGAFLLLLYHKAWDITILGGFYEWVLLGVGPFTFLPYFGVECACLLYSRRNCMNMIWSDHRSSESLKLEWRMLSSWCCSLTVCVWGVCITLLKGGTWRVHMTAWWQHLSSSSFSGIWWLNLFLSSMQIYPLFLAIGAALGICGYAMARNLAINPDVRWRIFISVIVLMFYRFSFD